MTVRNGGSGLGGEWGEPSAPDPARPAPPGSRGGRAGAEVASAVLPELCPQLQGWGVSRRRRGFPDRRANSLQRLLPLSLSGSAPRPSSSCTSGVCRGRTHHYACDGRSATNPEMGGAGLCLCFWGAGGAASRKLAGVSGEPILKPVLEEEFQYSLWGWPLVNSPGWFMVYVASFCLCSSRWERRPMLERLHLPQN